ncbi:MAG: YdcF family protein [Minisyncoccota bacterium]
MSEFGSSAVLIHGLHLGADDWDNIMLGESGYGKEGRILRGLSVAFEEDAPYIFWGTGASEINGVKEGQYILDYALSRVSEIAEHLEMSSLQAEEFILSRSVVHTMAQNTPEEIRAVMESLRRNKIKKLFVVSSPTHGGRCLTEGDILRLGEFLDDEVRVFATSSDVSYFGSTPKDVVIIEPPHRGDRVQTYPLSETARKAMRRSRESDGAEFLKALAEFVGAYGSPPR